MEAHLGLEQREIVTSAMQMVKNTFQQTEKYCYRQTSRYNLFYGHVICMHLWFVPLTACI